MTNRLPEWLRRPIPIKGYSGEVSEAIDKSSLKTVCNEARCPNKAECYGSGTATFLVMGDRCSRTCHFCSVQKQKLKPLDPSEPQRLLESVRAMDLNYAVITTVTRDDLSDGGSEHIARMIDLLKTEEPNINIEVLVPDFGGDEKALRRIIDSGVDVFGHNVEMIERLYKALRPEAEYKRSLDVLQFVEENSSIPVKTGIMVGLGETNEEVFSLLDDLITIKIDTVTIGQYLRPSSEQVKVNRYVTPKDFALFSKYGKENGIFHVESGPYVRSSYHAKDIFNRKHAVNSVLL